MSFENTKNRNTVSKYIYNITTFEYVKYLNTFIQVILLYI